MNAEWTRLSISTYLDALGSSAPTPGGGSAAAFAGALSAALGRMIVSVAQTKEDTPERQLLATAFRNLEARFLELAVDDERAFEQVMEALRLPKDSAGRAERLQGALEQAARIPLDAAGVGVAVLGRLVDVEPHASRAIVSDVGVAAHLALAAVRSSLLNVTVNVRSFSNPAAATRFDPESSALRAQAEAQHAGLVARVEERLAPRRS